jgi:hypothetical protein
LTKTTPPARLPWLLLAVAVAAPCWPSAGASSAEAGSPRTVAVFPVEFADTSGEAPGAGRAERVAATTEELADLLEESGKYREVDLAPVRQRLAAAGPLHLCGGCWLDIAQEAGAEVAAVTVVHKMSTLIASMHVWMVDVAAKRVIRDGAVSLRGDTDEAWRRAAGYLVRNVVLKEDTDRPSLSSPFPGG